MLTLRYIQTTLFRARKCNSAHTTQIHNARVGTCHQHTAAIAIRVAIDLRSRCLHFLHVSRSQQCIPCIPQPVDVVQQPLSTDWTPNDLKVRGPLRHELTAYPHARHRLALSVSFPTPSSPTLTWCSVLLASVDRSRSCTFHPHVLDGGLHARI